MALRRSPHTTAADLEVGRGAKIVTVGGEAGTMIRLLEMGFTPGTFLVVIKTAPFGDPIEFRVRGYHLSIRRADAQFIQVEAEDG